MNLQENNTSSFQTRMSSILVEKMERQQKLKDLKKSNERADDQLATKARQKVLIGSQLTDEFGRYVDSGDFSKKVDFKLAEVVGMQRGQKALP